MSKKILTIIFCLIAAMQVTAQSLTETEVVKAVNYARGLMKSNEYDDARNFLYEVSPYVNGEAERLVKSQISLTWYYEGAYNFEKDRYDVALLCYENALKAYHELGDVENEMTIQFEIAWTNAYLNNISEAISRYENALALSQQISDEASQIEIIGQLIKLCNIIGDMEQIVKYNDMMNFIIENTDDDQTKFNYYIQKGKEARKLGEYNMAEQWLLKCKVIIDEQDSLFVNANKYVMCLNLRDLYLRVRRYDEALEYAMLTLEEAKIGSSDITDYYMSYIPIANIYCNMDDKHNCYRYLDSLFVVEPYLDEPKGLYQLYEYRAICHRNFDDYEAALADYKKADEILAPYYPVTDGNRVRLQALMGGVENMLEYYAESEHHYNIYAAAIKEIYGGHSLEYVNALINLSNAQGFANNIKEGCNNYKDAVNNLKDIIKERLPYMNTAERETFWNTLSPLFTNMTPYALQAELYQTEYTKTCYDALLMSKAFLLESERSLYDILKEENLESDMHTYNTIAMLKNNIKEWEKDYDMYADSILSAYNKVNKLESILMKSCKSFGDITSFVDVNHKNIKNALKKNEYLIDFTDFVSKSQGRKYAAYVIEKKQKYPLLVPLFAEKQIDSLGIVRPDMFYDKDYSLDVVELLWEPLKNHVKEGSTIYYVPSQLIFQVCLESLSLGDGTLLGEHYNFVRLSSARELLREKKSNDKSSAVLYGGLQYDMEPEMLAENAKQYDISSLLAMRGDICRGDFLFNELPGSKIEIEKIMEILNKSSFDVTSYMGMYGTEESFLNMHKKSPKILHLATHGFYYTPNEADGIDYLKGYTDAMSLSGLIMSGGNVAWSGKELPEGVLGGVLTADNIACLDLSETDMVVLSACQSGQGDVTSEGLYGLQRAFKKAGVGTMVMALWRISDKVTTEFMIAFYERLSENNWDKRKAFDDAKSIIREQYPDPYYWAAFVMLD